MRGNYISVFFARFRMHHFWRCHCTSLTKSGRRGLGLWNWKETTKSRSLFNLFEKRQGQSAIEYTTWKMRQQWYYNRLVNHWITKGLSNLHLWQYTCRVESWICKCCITSQLCKLFAKLFTELAHAANTHHRMTNATDIDLNQLCLFHTTNMITLCKLWNYIYIYIYILWKQYVALCVLNPLLESQTKHQYCVINIIIWCLWMKMPFTRIENSIKLIN